MDCQSERLGLDRFRRNPAGVSRSYAPQKFLLSEETLAKWDNLLDKLTTLKEVDIKLNFPRDQKDSMFLACALATEADYLITGDRDFNEARKMVNTIILSVSQFKKLFIDTE